MKTIVLDIVVVLALAAPGAALVLHAYNSSPQIAWDDQPQAPTRVAGAASEELAPAPGYSAIDDWGVPLFVPGHAG